MARRRRNPGGVVEWAKLHPWMTFFIAGGILTTVQVLAQSAALARASRASADPLSKPTPPPNPAPVPRELGGGTVFVPGVIDEPPPRFVPGVIDGLGDLGDINRGNANTRQVVAAEAPLFDDGGRLIGRFGRGTYVELASSAGRRRPSNRGLRMTFVSYSGSHYGWVPSDTLSSGNTLALATFARGRF